MPVNKCGQAAACGRPVRFACRRSRASAIFSKLPDAFTADTQPVANFLECVWTGVADAEPQFQHLPLALTQRLERHSRASLDVVGQQWRFR